MICLTQPAELLWDTACFKFPENYFQIFPSSIKSDTETHSVGAHLQDDTGYPPNNTNGLNWINSTAAAQIARFMGPTWGPPGADTTQVGPMILAIWEGADVEIF